jgi:hypothetical protein
MGEQYGITIQYYGTSAGRQYDILLWIKEADNSQQYNTVESVSRVP